MAISHRHHFCLAPRASSIFSFRLCKTYSPINKNKQSVALPDANSITRVGTALLADVNHADVRARRTTLPKVPIVHLSGNRSRTKVSRVAFARIKPEFNWNVRNVVLKSTQCYLLLLCCLQKTGSCLLECSTSSRVRRTFDSCSTRTEASRSARFCAIRTETAKVLYSMTFPEQLLYTYSCCMYFLGKTSHHFRARGVSASYF